VSEPTPPRRPQGAARDGRPDRTALRTPTVLGLAVVVTLEFLAVAVLTVVLVVDILVAPPASIASGLALIVLAAIAALWLGAMVVGLARGRSWSRSGVLVWQFLQVALAVGAFQGVFRVPAIGWVLLVPALVALALVFAPTTTAVLARRDDAG
jgi:hypothetical protein